VAISECRSHQAVFCQTITPAICNIMFRSWLFLITGITVVDARRLADLSENLEAFEDRSQPSECRRRRCPGTVPPAPPPPAPPPGEAGAAACRRRRCDIGPPTTPPPLGPMYKCETTPTWGLSSRLCCKWNPAKAACFSLNPRVHWRCASLTQGPEWATSSDENCGRKDETGNFFDGRCLVEGHPDYDSAADYDGPGIVMTRTPDPSRGMQVRHPPYSTPPPAPVSGEAIGWNPMVNVTAGTGYWCEVGVPSPDFRLGSCAGPSVEAKVLSYNQFWWRLYGEWGGADGSAGKLIRAHGPYDFMGFQECGDVNRVLNDAGMLNSYSSYSGRNAVAVAWKESDWQNVSVGSVDVAEDGRHQYYGYREVVYVRLQHRTTGKMVFFINHHGPTPIQTAGGFCGPEATAYQILKVIAERAFVGDSVVLVGDFNARAPQPEYDTVANTTTLSLLENHMNLLFRGHVFGGIDNFYTNCATVAQWSDGNLKTENLGLGDMDTLVWHHGQMVYGGSDHDALTVTLNL